MNNITNKKQMDEQCFRPLFGTVKAELGRGGITWDNEMNLGWNIALVQYWSLDPPYCSPPRYK